VLGGRKVRILRFSYCEKDRWNLSTRWFESLLNSSLTLELDTIFYMQRELGRQKENAVNGISVYVEDDNGEKDWYDLSRII